MKFLLFILRITIFILAVSCTQRIKEEKITPSSSEKGRFLYVLNEGLFQHNNSTLTRYNLDNQIVEKDIFGRINGQRLGDTGNDIAIYGGKLYILVTVSSQLFITDVHTVKLIKRLPLLNDTNIGREPRRMAFYQNKIYVSCFDGFVLQIDTSTLNVEKAVYSGRNPEGIAIVNHKLYVANSGGKDFPNYDSTLSIFNLSDLTLLKKITVGVNPTKILAGENIKNRLFICLKGNYSTIPQRWITLDAQADTILTLIRLRPDLDYVLMDDELLGARQDNKTLFLERYNALSGEYQGAITGLPSVSTLYGLAYLPEIQSIIFSDARGFVNTGKVYVYDRSGTLRHSFDAELNPAHYASRAFY